MSISAGGTEVTLQGHAWWYAMLGNNQMVFLTTVGERGYFLRKTKIIFYFY